jgi:hypothetical protein
VITARILWSSWNNAQGLRAGAVIAVLGGLCAKREGRAIVPTVSQDLDSIEVAGKLEPKSLAAGIAADAHQRVAEAVTLTIDWLEEEGHGLMQVQKAKFFECVLRCADGFERQTVDSLMREFSRIERSDDAS